MNKRNIIVLYTIMTYALTLLFINSGYALVNALAQVVPGFIALLMIVFSRQRINDLKQTGLLRLGKFRWYIIAFVVPVSAIVFSYLMGSFLGYFSADLNFSWPPLIYKILQTTFTMPFLFALGEEIGWRGFLQPRLTDLLGLKPGIFLTGIIWAVWHFIFIFFDGYYSDGNALINASLFTIAIVFMSFSIGWIRSVSQSIWPCVIFHSASNATLWMFSWRFKAINPNAVYISGEAGILNIVFWAICLGIIWQKTRPASMVPSVSGINLT